MIVYTAKGSVEIVETKVVTLYAKRGICRSTFCLASGMTTPSTRDPQTDRGQEDWIDLEADRMRCIGTMATACHRHERTAQTARAMLNPGRIHVQTQKVVR